MARWLVGVLALVLVACNRPVALPLAPAPVQAAWRSAPIPAGQGRLVIVRDGGNRFLATVPLINGVRGAALVPGTATVAELPAGEVGLVLVLREGDSPERGAVPATLRVPLTAGQTTVVRHTVSNGFAEWKLAAAVVPDSAAGPLLARAQLVAGP